MPGRGAYSVCISEDCYYSYAPIINHRYVSGLGSALSTCDLHSSDNLTSPQKPGGGEVDLPKVTQQGEEPGSEARTARPQSRALRQDTELPVRAAHPKCPKCPTPALQSWGAGGTLC